MKYACLLLLIILCFGIIQAVDFEVTVLDDLVGLDGCWDPVHSLNGRRIAFIYNRTAYIMTRR